MTAEPDFDLLTNLALYSDWDSKLSGNQMVLIYEMASDSQIYILNNRRMPNELFRGIRILDKAVPEMQNDGIKYYTPLSEYGSSSLWNYVLKIQDSLKISINDSSIVTRKPEIIAFFAENRNDEIVVNFNEGQPKVDSFLVTLKIRSKRAITLANPKIAMVSQTHIEFPVDYYEYYGFIWKNASSENFTMGEMGLNENDVFQMEISLEDPILVLHLDTWFYINFQSTQLLNFE